MSNFFPFNFKPVATTSTQGNVTIPGNQYAFVTAYASNGANFTVNGVPMLTSQAESLIHRVINGINDSFTVTSGYFFEGNGFTSSGANQITVDGNVVMQGGSTGDPTAGPIKAGPGATVTTTTSNASVSGYERREAIDSQGSYWLGPNDAITGGARVHITYYQIP